jgi:hypothetical protein
MLDGPNAMNPDPDYSAGCLVLETDRSSGLTGEAIAAGDPDLARAAPTGHIAAGARWLRA